MYTNITGSLQIKKGRPNYYVVINYTDEATGKRKPKWITTDIPIKGNNKRKADSKLNEILAEYNSKKTSIGKDVLFVDFIEKWLENMQGKIQVTTYDAYKLTLDKHIIPYFKPKKLKVQDLTPTHIQDYCNLKMLKLSVNTIKKHVANISKCLDGAVKQNIIAFNPAQRIELQGKQKYMGAKVYNEKQIQQLLACIKDDPLEIVILLTLFYGLRRSEVLGIKWSAIDFDSNTIAIQHTVVKVNGTIHKKDMTKNKSSYRTVPLCQILKSQLLKLRSRQLQNRLLQPNDYIDEGYVCVDIRGELFKTDYVSKHFKLILKRNSLESIRFHDIRHSSATYLRSLGFSMKDVQVWLGHASIVTTMNTYTHLDIEDKRLVADKLNEKFVSFGV